MQHLSDEFKARKNKIIGSFHKNYQGNEFKVLNYYLNSNNNSKKVLIEFLDSGYITFTTPTVVRSGKITDRLSPTVSKVGKLGYATFKNNEKAYHIWKAMLKRCYDVNCKNYNNYGGKGVSVCEDWKRFDYFLLSLKHIDGYDEENFNCGKLDLDKDLKQRNVKFNEKIYSPYTCTFMSKADNAKLLNGNSKGIKIKVKNIVTDEVYFFESISSFSKKYKFNRRTVNNYLNREIPYKNWKISEVV